MKRALAALYVAFLRAWLRWGKAIPSWVYARLKPQAAIDWERVASSSLEEYAAWLQAHTRWVSDPLWGLLDLYPSLGYLFWQLEHKGVVEDDCDGLAYFALASVTPYCDTPGDRYLVDLVLDPFQISLARSAHAICVFRAGGKWRVISNGVLDPDAWDTFEDAVRQNSYARGYRVLWWAARDANLRRVPAPKP